MKKIIGVLILIGLLTAAMAPFTVARPVADETQATPVFLDVYTSPRYPIGADWDTGLGGDEITVFANVTNVLDNDVWVTWAFCNRVFCLPDTYDVMTHLGGTLYQFVLPGDASLPGPYFEASSDPGQHIYIRLDADPTGGVGDYTVYPAPGDWHNIYPAWGPQQINATSGASKTDMFVGETFTVSGTSNYWNSTSYPNDFSQLFPADECYVEVNVDGVTYDGWTDVDGNYAIQVTAPANAGPHQVTTTISNSTANRNVPCVSNNIPITVNDIPQVDEISVLLDDDSVYPGDAVTVSGIAIYDDTGDPVETTKAYVNLTGDPHTTSTNAFGEYSQVINAPMDPGNHVISVTVVDEIYDGSKNTNTTNLNVETPTLDVTANPNSTTPFPSTTLLVTGTATYGNGEPAIAAPVTVAVDGTAIINTEVKANSAFDGSKKNQ